MTGLAIALLFGAAFAAALWTLVSSVAAQRHRFAELFRPMSTLPALPPRAPRLTVRAARVRPTAPGPRRAAA